MTCVTRKEVERSEPFEKGLDLKSVWGRQNYPEFNNYFSWLADDQRWFPHASVKIKNSQQLLHIKK